MIELNGYAYPEKGKRFGSMPVWVNPDKIVHFSTVQMDAERFPNGMVFAEKVTVTSIAFDFAIGEEQGCVLVIDSPAAILLAIHHWTADRNLRYGQVFNG